MEVATTHSQEAFIVPCKPPAPVQVSKPILTSQFVIFPSQLTYPVLQLSDAGLPGACADVVAHSEEPTSPAQV